MQIRKTTRNWAIAGAVAAMLGASSAGVRAQDAPAATPPAPAATPMPSAPMATTDNSGSMSGNMSSGSMMSDYSILSNPHYDYIDLQQAKARGLSDSQIATVAKIAKQTGMPFRMVSAAVERGETFAMLASEYNLKLGDVYENDKEKQEISDYNTAYEAAKALGTGSGSMMSGGMASGSGMSGGMASSSTMTPDATATAPAAGMATLDIVDTAMAAKNLTTLVKALQVAGLVETLKGAGPFTVFAPSDRAFAKLPAGQLDALLADPAKLKTILTYHVIPASIMAADASAMTSPTSPPTVQGGTLQVTKDGRGRLKVNDATITKADIKASNGVIHIINQVLMPPADGMAPAAGATAPTTGAAAPDAGAAAPAVGGTAPAAPAPGTDTTAPPVAPANPPATPATPAQ